MLLQLIQDRLTLIYDVPCAYNVGDFLITDRALLPPHLQNTRTTEQVLVAGDTSDTRISVYLDSDMLNRLEVANPFHALGGHNIADFWAALEGVSHFLYLVFHAQHDRTVGLLNLELQAEVDKFVLSYQLLKEQTGLGAPQLHRLLFRAISITRETCGERYELYRLANEYAASFCAHLELSFNSRRLSRTLHAHQELKRFYRAGLDSKLKRISAFSSAANKL